MTRVSLKTELGVSPEMVWDLIGSFNALPDWHPSIEKSELKKKGEVRELSLAGVGTIIEKLEKLDDGERVYSYTITDGPLPVSNYKATISVKEDADGTSVVEWSSEFDASGAPENEAAKVIEGIYQAGFDNLKRIFGSQ